jgi:lactate permease
MTAAGPIDVYAANGPIFRKVWWHSVAGAAVIGAIALIQAY